MKTQNLPLGYLRMFLTLMVVAHHAVLAYHPYAPPPAQSLDSKMVWGAFPIVDSARWPGIDLFVAFNDIFFMSLMFLISGIFAWTALARKGAAVFMRDRARKLGLGFLVSAAVFAPLAYYPTYLAIKAPQGSFWTQWMSIGKWPAGPAWFLWVLLVLAGIAALGYAVAPKIGAALGRFAERVGERPIRFFGALIVVSALAYLPMAAAFDAFSWVSAGPFFVQIGRLLHYAAYFLVGMALGACGLDRGLLASDGRLARRWGLWLGASLVAFVVAIVSFVIILSTLAKGGPGPVLATFGNFTFVLSCAASSLAFLAIFTRFARRPNRIADSLSANAFGIYLVHYFCVTWLQLALLDTPLSGAAKGTLVFLGAVAASWGLTAGFRRAVSGLRATAESAPVVAVPVRTSDL